jgi:SAM-dependent methyltransferase
MTEIIPCPPKRHAELALEWDQLAEERHRQIASGDDLSFDNVVAPESLRLLEGANLTSILDIGSGTGDFTLRLARVAREVTAVEPSRVSVNLARQVCGTVNNVKFIESSLEDATSSLLVGSFTAAVAVMTLMTSPNLNEFAMALARILPSSSIFVATITHPCLWPSYWGYENEPWFNYKCEQFIEAPFAISRARARYRTTHVHRPLEQYIDVFSDQGFRLETLSEPLPPLKVQTQYPTPWRFPRFLGLKWRKIC